jgi:acetyl-CoA acetyltransferase
MRKLEPGPASVRQLDLLSPGERPLRAKTRHSPSERLIEKLNVNGGSACALGRPAEATGARLIVTLLHTPEVT